MKKRIALVVITCLLSILLVACGNNDSTENAQNATTPESSNENNTEIAEEFTDKPNEEISEETSEEVSEETAIDTSIEISDDKYTYIIGDSEFNYDTGNYEPMNVFGFNFDIEGYVQGNSVGSSVGGDRNTTVTKSFTFREENDSGSYLIIASTDVVSDSTNVIELMKYFLEKNTIPEPDSDTEKILSMNLKDTIDTTYGPISILYATMEYDISSYGLNAKVYYCGYEAAIIHVNNREISILYSYRDMDSAPEYEGFLKENLPVMLQEK